MVKENLTPTEVMSAIGTGLSVVCLITLWTAWYLMPPWRTLQNYIGVNQIMYGTVHMALSTVCIQLDTLDGIIEDVLLIISGFLFHATLTWSLASALLAHLKLVLLHNGTISHGKICVTVFVIGSTVIVKIAYLVVLRRILSLSFNQVFKLGLHAIYMIITLILFIFIRVVLSVLSCCKPRMSKKKVKHILSVIGVAIICDTGTLLWLYLLIVLDSHAMDAWFYFRLIPQSMFLLLNPSSKAHWKWYFKRRKRMRAVV